MASTLPKLWAVVKREYLERVRSKWFLASTILAPILFGGLLMLPLWLVKRSTPSADTGRIIILDASGAGLGRRVAAELNGGIMGDTSLTRIVETTPAALPTAEREATRAVMDREVKGYLVLGAGTLQAMRARYSGSNATSQVDMRSIERIVEEQVLALRLERAGMDPAQVKALSARDFHLEAERLTEKGRGGSGKVRSGLAFGVAFLLYMAIFLYGQNVLRGVMEEKQTRVAEVIVSSIPSTQLMAGKVIGVGAVGVTQLVISVASSMAIYRARGPLLAQFGLPQIPFDLPSVSPGTALLLLAFFLLGYLFYAAIFAAVGAMVSSEHEAQQVLLPAAMLLILSALLIQPVLLAPESRLAFSFSLLPFSAPIIMPLRLSLVEVPASEIVLSIISLIAGCYIAVWTAARIYRTGILMYGKRPTLGELVRWVRLAR
ncbi:MAG TPA: ABC transporter permease [Gemmatimonadaceae bacterium]|nr:ABC transporter permease [Gemmatimonadaceae bacterium]